MFFSPRGIDDMESLLAALKAFLDERQQHPILLVRAVKERADVTLRPKHCAGQPNRRCALMRHVPGKSGPALPLCLTLIIAGVHMALLEKTMVCLARQQGYPMTNALRDVCRVPWPHTAQDTEVGS